MDLTQFTNKAELFNYLRLNKDILKRKKIASFKNADACTVNYADFTNDIVVKEFGAISDDPNILHKRVIINTTNILDSHGDVHIKGLWKKNINESKTRSHVQEHSLKFDKIISDGTDLKTYTKEYTFKELGFDYEGTTEALVFDSIIHRKRNPFMFEQYENGYVKNHSVGMYYVKLELCLNSDSKYDKVEKENFDKYFPLIANKREFEEINYFWAVLEAKAIEGSAVVIGSNQVTPTIEIQADVKSLENSEPSENDTQKIEYKQILQTLKI